ncbi:MAG: helix-turn-helix transcriptional regulator, partial [Clostridia bacterium]|nr:helix-turn-helix transcriptional regulator [Clostridia bacterium]
YFTNQSSIFLCRKGEGGASYGELEALLRETAALHRSEEVFCELSIKGNVYKICALLLQMLNLTEVENTQNKKRTDLKKIDQALEQIYNYYNEPLTVEEVSAFCGYGKSNFCKIFKSITGNTFHYTLNQHRVEVACMLLKESDQTVEEIARDTGFADAKSFCRVFKQFMNQSAGAYRKSIKAK